MSQIASVLSKLVWCGLWLIAAATALAEEQRKPLKVIEPRDPPARASAAAIDTERFEVAVNLGLLSVEDFNTNALLGLSFNYYIAPSLFVQLAYGTSKTQRANTEGNQNFNAERDFSYTGAALGYRVLEGRSFRGNKRKFNTGLYLLAGVEQVEFAETDNTGAMLGISYRTVLNDAMTLNIDFKDHIVSREFQRDDKMTQNVEFAVGLGFIF